MALRGTRAPATGGRLLVVGVPAPAFTVPGLVAPECAIWLDLNVSLFLPMPVQSQWSQSYTIPNTPALSGVQVNAQAVFGATRNLSNTLQLTIGK